jgi:hypothetical protein
VDSNSNALNEAWSGTVTPYGQIKDNPFDPEVGWHDFIVSSLTPGTDKNGLYVINGEFKITAPASEAQGPAANFKRTLYVGSKKDPMAALPETRLNSPSLRFLKNIAKANHLPTNDQSDAKLCAGILAKPFSCRIEERKYKDALGQDRTARDFGRNVVPVGTIPARLDRDGTGSLAAFTPPGNGSTLPEGTSFASE